MITEGSVLEESREVDSETHVKSLARGRRKADGVMASIGKFMRIETHEFMPDCHLTLCSSRQPIFTKSRQAGYWTEPLDMDF